MEPTLVLIKQEIGVPKDDFPQEEEKVVVKQETPDFTASKNEFVGDLNVYNLVETHLKQEDCEDEEYNSEITPESSNDATDNTKAVKLCGKDTEGDQPVKKCTRRKVTCLVCGLVCRDNSSYKFHMMDHTGIRPYKCDTCDKSYKKQIDLSYHMKSHTGKHDIHCETCGKGFTVRSALRAHSRTHSQEKPYICPICDKGFSHRSGLKPHIATHSDDFPFGCDKCHKKYKNNNALARHKLNHGDGFRCGLCKKSYRTNEGLKLHMQKHLSTPTEDEKPRENLKRYACELCGNIYKHLISLKNHLRMHNNDKYTCNVCGKAYIDKNRLRIHLRNHTGETPYECNVCGKKYKRRDSFVYHKTTHQDRKVFKCDICGKVLFCENSLQSHKALQHSLDDWPYTCVLCDRTFKKRYNLVVHMRIHENSSSEAKKGQIEEGASADACKVKKEAGGESSEYKRLIGGESKYGSCKSSTPVGETVFVVVKSERAEEEEMEAGGGPRVKLESNEESM